MRATSSLLMAVPAAIGLLWMEGPALASKLSSAVVERVVPRRRRLRNATKPHISTFLHIPKTGTSIELEILQYLCEPDTIKELDHLFHEVDRKHPIPCAVPVRPGHAPLKAKTARERTVTVVRSPVKRMASGFMHSLHDCLTLEKKLHIHNERQGIAMVRDQFCPSIEKMAEGVDPSNLTAEELQAMEDTRQVIETYIPCVSGCATKMLSGVPCGSKYHRPYTAEVEKTLESLLFIGMTDFWEETICMWHDQFKMSEGRQYFPTRNTRMSPNKDCEHNLVHILNRDYGGLMAKDPDWAVYNKTLQLFQDRLPSHCGAEEEEET